MTARNTPITIRGVEYPSSADAARTLGVDKSTITYSKKRGRLDLVGLGTTIEERRKAVTIRGVNYASINAAAKALGVTKALIQKAIKRGTVDNIGTGVRLDPGPDHIANKPVVIRGVEYPSRALAAEILGVSGSVISRAEKRGTLDRVGLGLHGRADDDF